MKPYDVQLERTRCNLLTIRRRIDDYIEGKVSKDPLFLIDTIFNFFC